MKMIKKLLRPLMWLNKRLLAFQRKHPILDFFLLVCFWLFLLNLFGAMYYSNVDVDLNFVDQLRSTTEFGYCAYDAWVYGFIVGMIFTHFFVAPRRFPENSKENEDSTNA